MLPRFRSSYKSPIEDYSVEFHLEDHRHEGSHEVATYKITCPVTFGHTIGNSMRRTIMSTSLGSSVVAIRIEGAKHEFDIVEGIKETVQQIVLNLKNLHVRFIDKTVNFSYLHIKKNKSGEVTAADFDANNEVEVITKDLLICTLDRNTSIEIECLVAVGTGYYQSHEHIFTPELHSDFFPVDSVFSRVECSYDVETNTGGKKNFDVITLQIKTNGEFNPEEVLRSAAKKLSNSFSLLAASEKDDSAMDVEDISQDQMLDALVLDLQLSARVKNCLLSNKIHTLKEILDKTPEELTSFAGFGEACLKEVAAYLDKHGLKLKETV